jgi:antibiotic biosynthesis monooxygenase (ABM) superfamily enzyme
MAKLFVHHKVADYAQWREVFDAVTHTRTSYGMTGQSVMQAAGDTNDLVVITDWKTVDQARAYATSADLKQAMQKAGVISQPEVLFLEEA